MDDVTTLEGPVESVDGQLILCIPLEAGGRDFVSCTRGIGKVEGDSLVIEIKKWLADKLGICEGSVVTINNENCRFNIYLSN